MHSRFEKGKKYVFTEKQFTIGRDSNNRLVFNIPDPVMAIEYRIPASKCQTGRIDKVTCIFNGSRLELDPFALAQQVYKPGEDREFFINSEVRYGRCTLRDEVNDITFKNIKIGKGDFKRFDRILCTIKGIGESTLDLTPIVEEKHNTNLFSVEDLTGLPEGRYLRGAGVMEGILTQPEFEETKRLLEEGDNRWAITFLENSMDYSVSMLKSQPKHKDYILRGMEELAVALIERSDYVSKVPEDEQRQVQERLEQVAMNAGDYWRAYNLMMQREADNTMQAILGSLERSSRFYHPEEKVRLMRALISLEAVDVNKYMDRVFTILIDHHSNPTFMHYFKQGMQQILARFIEERRGSIGSIDRESLRLLLRALAMEQLLDNVSGDPVIARRRGLLYTCAAIYIDSCDNTLPAKAIQSYTGLVQAPLEFGWVDLKDPNPLHLCYGQLTRPFPAKYITRAIASYCTDDICISSELTDLVVSTSPEINMLKRVLSYELFPGMNITVAADERVSGIANILNENPLIQRSYFQDLRRVLRHSEMRASVPRQTNLRPQVNDEVHIYVTDVLENGIFQCLIYDPVYTGSGTMLIRDIVPYDCFPTIKDFRSEEGLPLIFPARVKGEMEDGTYMFTIRPHLLTQSLQEAAYDRDSQADVPCVITGTYKAVSGDIGYFGLSDKGYPLVLFPKDIDYELHRNDQAVVKVTYVSSKDGNLFVKTQFLFDAEPDADTAPLSLDSIFRSTMANGAVGVVEDYEVQKAMNTSSSATDEHHEIIEIERSGLVGVVVLINLMASIEGTPLGRSYTMIHIASIIARQSGLDKLAYLLETKCQALEVLGGFADGSRVDLKALSEVEKESESIREMDSSLRHTLQLLHVLAGLDHTEMLSLGKYPENSLPERASRLVNAYNLLWSSGLNQARREILKGLYELIGVKVTSEIDVVRLKVQEDDHNEFKQSLIYPADNNMKADDHMQGREIMEIVDGMLNHEGGTIYLGVNNEGVPIGLNNDFKFLNKGNDRYDLRDIEDKFSLHFHYHLRYNIGLNYNGIPIHDYVKLSFDTIDGKVIGRVSVEPFPGMVKMKDGKVYQRQDSSTLQVPVKDQAAFAAQRARK